MESAWSNGKAAYRCRHGHTSAAPPDPARPKNAYVREDRILPHLPALHLLLTGTEPARRRRTRRGADTRPQASAQDVIGYLRARGITLTYDPAAGTPAGRHLRGHQDHHQESRLTPRAHRAPPRKGEEENPGRPAQAQASARVTSPYLK